MESAVLAPGLLLAAPPLGDPNFSKSVVLLASHGLEGSLGWVVNGLEIAPVSQLLRDAGLQPVHVYGTWCVPNLFYRVFRRVLLRTGLRLPLQPPVPLLGSFLAWTRKQLGTTPLPLYTGMNIGCLARKETL